MDDIAPLDVEHVFSLLFTSMVGRAPARHEIVRLQQQLKAGMSLEGIIDWFRRSAEYKRHIVSAIGQLDVLPPNRIDLALSAVERKALWTHVAEIWARMGAEDPYWSVITMEQYRRSNMSEAERIEQFYDCGRAEVERIESYLARAGRPFPEGEMCVDYGCGVGRVTLWLARRCRRVLAVDISETHLAIAREQLAARGVTNVEFCLVRQAEDLDVLDNMTFFHSIMAFQHNPPPLIADMLSAVFNGLSSGGCAFFQLPTYARGYEWDYQTYVSRLMGEKRMELHVLPQSTVFDLAAKAGCKAVEVQPDSMVKVGVPHWISNTFLFTKPDGNVTPARAVS
jgi:SAM-dependent methyltransferase